MLKIVRIWKRFKGKYDTGSGQGNTGFATGGGISDLCGIIKTVFPDKQYYSTNMMQEAGTLSVCHRQAKRERNGAGVQWGQRCIRHGESGL